MAGLKIWTQEETEELIKLYIEGVHLEKLAEDMGKSYCSVKARLTYLRKQGVDIPLRDQRVVQRERRSKESREGNTVYAKRLSDFEKQWYGRVPRGHWTITKPWKKENVA